jgi:hypothetical protein
MRPYAEGTTLEDLHFFKVLLFRHYSAFNGLLLATFLGLSFVTTLLHLSGGVVELAAGLCDSLLRLKTTLNKPKPSPRGATLTKPTLAKPTLAKPTLTKLTTSGSVVELTVDVCDSLLRRQRAPHAIACEDNKGVQRGVQLEKGRLRLLCKHPVVVVRHVS